MNTVNYCSPRSQRFMLILSLVLMGVFFGGWLMTGLFPLPSPSLKPLEVAELYTRHNLQTRIGVILCLISGGFTMPWVTVVAVQMARLERGVPIWAIAQLVAGTLGVILFMIPVLIWGWAAFTPTRPPEITHAISEIGFLALVTPTTFFWLQVLPMAVVAITAKQDEASGLPRWTGFLSAAQLLVAELGVLAFLAHSGPFAWNGVFPFWVPLVGLGVWLPLVTIAMFRGISKQEALMKRADGGQPAYG